MAFHAFSADTSFGVSNVLACVHSALPRAARGTHCSHPRDVSGGPRPRRGRTRRHRGVAVRARAALGRRARMRAAPTVLEHSRTCRVVAPSYAAASMTAQYICVTIQQFVYMASTAHACARERASHLKPGARRRVHAASAHPIAAQRPGPQARQRVRLWRRDRLRASDIKQKSDQIKSISNQIKSNQIKSNAISRARAKPRTRTPDRHNISRTTSHTKLSSTRC
jgi:hypothetical protein